MESVLQGTQGSAFPLTGILGLAAVLYGLYQLRGSGGAYTVHACNSCRPELSVDCCRPEAASSNQTFSAA